MSLIIISSQAHAASTGGGGSKPDKKPPILLGITEGPFIQGSSIQERKIAYELDEKADIGEISKKQGWYDHEIDQKQVNLGYYKMARTPVTNAQYHHFVLSTGYPAPNIDEETWNSYKTPYPYKDVKDYLWDHGHPPQNKSQHPVVLVSLADAIAYAEWLSLKTNSTWRLPTEAEWEKAIRGADGRIFPWGNVFYDSYLNSADRGPGETQAVASYDAGRNSYGLMDGAGQVFEWTTTEIGQQKITRDPLHIVKGGSWANKGCGMCRPAARHPRPASMKHILIGFRVLQE